MREELSDEFVLWLRSLKVSKRAERARDYLIDHQTVTSEQLNKMGYDHPPRIIGDLKEAGVRLDKETVKSSTGKNIAQYFLVEEITEGRLKRTAIPKKFRDALNEDFGFHCGICHGVFEGRELQVDHRIPFLIAGERPVFEIEDYMPLCASDNRSKSWSCEHCPNWTVKDLETCMTCFWAHPEGYEHVAGRQERRLVMTFQDNDVAIFDSLRAAASEAGETVGEYLIDRFRSGD